MINWKINYTINHADGGDGRLLQAIIPASTEQEARRIFAIQYPKGHIMHVLRF